MIRFSLKHYRKRLTALKQRLAQEDVDYAVIMDGSRLRYLVGYTGSNGLLIVGNGKSEFFTDGRYREQVNQEVRGARPHIVGGDLISHLAGLKLLAKGRPKIGYEPQLFSEQSAGQLRKTIKSGLFIPLPDMVAPLMQIKDADELACIKQAAGISDRAFVRALEVIRPGVSERHVAAEIEYHMTEAGSEKPAFETIVASGPRSALPHGDASARRIKAGDFVTLDFGATVNGYVSDMTRTVVVGRASARQRRIYDMVLRAQRAAVAKARAGVVCSDLDEIARRIIKRSGHGKRFDHGLGHGIGLVVHEGPSINPRNSGVLKSGMVITIEPGVYFPGWGGVRIEDDVLIQSRRGVELTKSPRALIEI